MTERDDLLTVAEVRDILRFDDKSDTNMRQWIRRKMAAVELGRGVLRVRRSVLSDFLKRNEVRAIDNEAKQYRRTGA